MKISNQFFCIRCLPLYSFLIFNTAISADRNSYELSTGLSLLNFGYKEFNSQNILLDREDDVIPGLNLTATKYWNDWSASIITTHHKGVVTYTGQTQGSTPVVTKSDTTISDLSLQVNYWLLADNKLNYGAIVYAGIGQHTWQRNIRSTRTAMGTPVSGVDERYQWDYYQFGTKFIFINDSKKQWMVDLQFNKAFDSKILVDFRGFGGFDPITLNLGETSGLKISSPFIMQFNNTISFKVEPYYENWKIEQSETKKFRINGILSNTSVSEPRSETNNFGINFSIVKIFN